MNIVVQNRRIISKGKFPVSKNINAYTLHVEFRDTENIGWSELSKKIVFKNEDVQIACPLFGDEIDVPWEVLQKDGWLFITVIGTQEEPYKKVVTEKIQEGILIHRSGDEAGQEPGAPTPDMVTAILDTANKAHREAEALRQDAENGRFNGAPGKDGVDGKDSRDGIDGVDGKDGYTPVKGKDYFDGAPGKDGEKGDPFTYDDFTPEQLEALRGQRGASYLETVKEQMDEVAEATSHPSYVDTEYIPNQDTRICITIQRMSESNYATAYGSETPRFSLLKSRVDYGQNVGITIPTMLAGEKYRVDHNKNSIRIENNTYKIAEYTEFTGSKPMYLFILNGYIQATTQFLGRIFTCKIYENDVLQRNFVPCLRKADGVVGFYDLITEKFYPGTGTFTYGELT